MKKILWSSFKNYYSSSPKLNFEYLKCVFIMLFLYLSFAFSPWFMISSVYSQYSWKSCLLKTHFCIRYLLYMVQTTFTYLSLSTESNFLISFSTILCTFCILQLFSVLNILSCVIPLHICTSIPIPQILFTTLSNPLALENSHFPLNRG